jgi:hypothetical protein
MLRKKIILIFSLLFLFAPLISAAALNYVPMEQIPGFTTTGDFPSYIMAVYKFGLWTVGIAAMLMIMIGGYMYLTSAGNTSRTGKAKEIIYDAIAGVILALVSYLLLYTINPDLLQIQPLIPISGAPGPGAGGIPGVPGGPAGTTTGYLAACSNASSSTPIDYARAATDNNISVNQNCNNYNFSNSSGIDAKTLKSIAQLESSCGSNKGPSSAGACGMMQILPNTASQLAGRTVTCQELINDNALSIDLAAKYVSQGTSSTLVSNARDRTAAIFAGYNSGYGCPSGPKHALCASADCPGALAYECCINPGGLSESINYAWNGVGLMNK